MIDAHCHLDRLAEPAAQLVEARAAGVGQVVVAGVDADGWQAQAALAAPGVHPAYGVHPWTAAHAPDPGPLVEALASWLGEHPAVAVGEIGLDASGRVPPDSFERQEAAFRAQLLLAQGLNLPVVLHLVRTHDRALSILREVGLPRPGGMVHGWSGSAQQAKAFLDLGLYLSFSGASTRSPKAAAAAAAVPLQRLLVETDAPDQAPDPHRGSANRLAWLPLVVEHVAAARGCAPAEVARATAGAARSLFSLPEVA